jgi:anaerobic ribonucleoside-triphosphate reductase activating protein
MLRILDITAPDINNGNGIRITLWVSGCNHHCKGCHNQWTWDFNQGKDFIEEQDDILNKLSNWLKRDYVEGLTLSGGDPLCQDKEGLLELKRLINWVRTNYPTKNIWMYTGYVYEDLKDLQKEIADSVDVLVDGPYKEELRDIAHTPFRGSTNQRILYLNGKK